MKNFKIDSTKIEWVFGQSFDDYQEQFVSLKNRNLSKIILDKFDNGWEDDKRRIDLSDKSNVSLENEPDEIND